MSADVIILPVRHRGAEPAVDEPFEVDAAPGMVALTLGVGPLATEHWMTLRRCRLLVAELMVIMETAERMDGDHAY